MDYAVKKQMMFNYESEESTFLIGKKINFYLFFFFLSLSRVHFIVNNTS